MPTISSARYPKIFSAVALNVVMTPSVVVEMIAKLRAVKPIREPRRDLQKKTLVRFVTT